MPKRIYLDNSTTTKPSDKAIAEMLPFLKEHWGVSTVPHQMGQELFPFMEEAYRKIYDFFGVKEDHRFVFTSSGEEAINHVFTSVYHTVTDPTGKNQYIVSSIAEAAPLMALARLEGMGCMAKVIKPTSFNAITKEQIADAITPRTALVSLCLANGLTGLILPIQEIAELLRQRGILLHLDLTHAIGKIYFDLEEINPAFITFNGDHLHAPKGTGGLFIQKDVKCAPFILGGLEQAGLRAGNFSVGALSALGAAAEEAKEAGDFICTETLRLRNKLEEGILREVKNAFVLFKNNERLPHVSLIGFSGLSNELMLYHLNKKNVLGSIGGGSFQKLSLILEGLLVSKKQAEEAINFTLSRYTTEDEIERAIKIVAECAKNLEKLVLNESLK